MITHLLVAVVAFFVLSVSPSKSHAAEQVRPATTRYSAKDLGWSLKLPQDDIVPFQGMASFDSAGIGTGHMVYPAPHLAGFFAAIITHGIINEVARNRQKSKIQEDADRVLAPYQQVLAGFKNRELMQLAINNTAAAASKRMAEQTEKPGFDLMVESVPVFSMTQDQTAIVLDNAIAIFAPGADSPATYKNIIRVVSRPETKIDIVSHWTTNGGDALKIESARLLAESLDIALGEMAENMTRNQPHKTVRYVEGSIDRMERGQVIRELCGRVVLINHQGMANVRSSQSKRRSYAPLLRQERASRRQSRACRYPTTKRLRLPPPCWGHDLRTWFEALALSWEARRWKVGLSARCSQQLYSAPDNSYPT